MLLRGGCSKRYRFPSLRGRRVGVRVGHMTMSSGERERQLELVMVTRKCNRDES